MSLLLSVPPLCPQREPDCGVRSQAMPTSIRTTNPSRNNANLRPERYKKMTAICDNLFEYTTLLCTCDRSYLKKLYKCLRAANFMIHFTATMPFRADLHNEIITYVKLLMLIKSCLRFYLCLRLRLTVAVPAVVSPVPCVPPVLDTAHGKERGKKHSFPPLIGHQYKPKCRHPKECCGLFCATLRELDNVSNTCIYGCGLGQILPSSYDSNGKTSGRLLCRLETSFQSMYRQSDVMYLCRTNYPPGSNDGEAGVPPPSSHAMYSDMQRHFLLTPVHPGPPAPRDASLLSSTTVLCYPLPRSTSIKQSKLLLCWRGDLWVKIRVSS